MEFISKVDFYTKKNKSEQRKIFTSLSPEDRELFRLHVNMSKRNMLEFYFQKEYKLFIEDIYNKPNGIQETINLQYDYEFNARPNQLIPEGDYRFLMVMAGRGFGKTWFGAQWVRHKIWVEGHTGVNIIGPTLGTVLKYMVPAIMAACPPHERPVLVGTELRWPNGVITLLFSADEPERLRGPNHTDIWFDEIGACRYAQDTYDQILMGLRLGTNPQMCLTTTPRGIKVVKDICKDSRTKLIFGSSFDNAPNLSPHFLIDLERKWAGTRLYRQEILGELLEENENALFSMSNVELNRIKVLDNNGVRIPLPDFTSIVVGVDPAVTGNVNSDNTGIVVAGKTVEGHYYILEDATMHGKPQDWALKVIQMYNKWDADLIIGEGNNGGDMIEALLRNISSNINYKKVTATRGKIMRAEPIASLYERNLVHHVGGFSDLETQMTNFTGSDPTQKSPDRLDALVWALTHLSMGTDGFTEFMRKERAEAERLKQEQERIRVEAQIKAMNSKPKYGKGFNVM